MPQPVRLGIGALRERVAIHTVSTTVSSAGYQTDSWTTTDTVWANVASIPDRELYQAQAIKASLAYRVTIRYRTDVTGKTRIVWDSKTLEIHNVRDLEDARDRFLVLDCSETS
uniref:Putative head-tail joining protein n=1 Tax=viral metagenome TaxID=1070528 RepID=A0A6M3LN13_9ZZZZ